MALTVQPCPSCGKSLAIRDVGAGVILLLVFAISCATGPKPDRDAPHLLRTVRADGVVLHLGVDSQALAARCRAAALLGQEVFRQQLGVSPFTPEVPLVVYLYRDPAEFRMARQWGYDPERPSWRIPTSANEHTSHFALLPRTDEAYLAMVGGVGAATLDALWFEIARQGLRRVEENRALRWPEWFKVGLAECLALECWWRDRGYPEVDPLWWTTERLLVMDAARIWRLTALPDFLRQGRADAPDDALYVARAATFCWFLKQDPARWRRLLNDVVGTLGDEHGETTVQATRRFNAGLGNIYGDTDLLEVRMLEALEKTEQRWIPFTGYPERIGDGFLLAGSYDDDPAICRRVLPGPVFDIEFDGRRRDDARGALLIYFAMDAAVPREFIRLGIHDDGTLSLVQFSDGDFGATFIYEFDREFLEPGVWTRIQILVTHRQLEVVIDGVLLLCEDMPFTASAAAEYIGIGSEEGIHEIRDIVHRLVPQAR